MGDKLFYDEADSPIGRLLIMSDGEKVVRIDYGTIARLQDKTNKWIAQYFKEVSFIHDPNKVKHVKESLHQYFQTGKREFTFEITLYGTPFQKLVWQALHEGIPYGETRTYKDIAMAIGNPKAVRAVGGAVNRNPLSIVVPCHRVIGSNGKMVGYNGGLDKKEFLLAHENNE
ncbi:O-6-methylguanine DNA methyltransferase [Virgibacillus halotolerans]|uniref:methylated-DNA--[protein]-cysteine S-methyltransferase n=1 Tax=Virgibacillus halotolerans TaxID=1071053 RepID=UPI00196228C3|nr:methylated-DNA--[protein]-cysteine S-methyltransferase [Virgibacillus halotolerans]MBM7600245.1 O-6-methylguanine DNA methyltransferase [Virgibacillus halotolerans]